MWMLPAASSEDLRCSTVSESELRLPTYDEVRDLPKDPPAYEVLFEAGRGEHLDELVVPPVPKMVSLAETGLSLLPPRVIDTSSQESHVIDDG